MKSEVYKEKVNKREELVPRIMNSGALLNKNAKTTSGELHVQLSRELKRALMSMLRFLNTYFELLQFIEIIYIINEMSTSFVFPSYLLQGVLCVTFKQLNLHTH